MTHIDSTTFGSITIDGKKFHQVLIIGDKIIERDAQKLNTLFNTTHFIGDWEIELLLKEKPDVIIIGNGQSGVLKVTEQVKKNLTSKGINLEIFLTRKAIEKYNLLRSSGKKVNALFHTTC